MGTSLKRNSFVFLARQIFLFGLSILVNLYTTQQLTSIDFGYIVVFTAILSAFSILSDGGMWVGFIQGKQGIDETLFGKMLAFVSAAVLAICGALFLAARVAKIEALSEYNALYYLIGIVICTAIQSVYYAKMERAFEISKIAICDILSNVIYACAMFILLGRGMGVEGFIIAILAKSVALLLSSVIFGGLKPRIDLRHFDPAFWHEIKRGLINQVSFVVNYLRTLTNPIIISSLFDSGTVGLVDRAVMFAGIPSGVIVAVSQKVLFPYFSSELRENNSIVRKIKESVFIASLGDKLFYIPLIVLMEPFVGKYLGSQWSGIVPMIYLLAVGNMIWGGASGVFSACLSGMGKFKLISALNLATTILSWILSIALTKIIGLWGFLLVSPLLWLLTLYSMRVVRSELGGFAIAYEIIYPSLISGLALGAVIFIKRYIYIENLLLEMAAFTAISYFIYGLLVLATERRFVPGILRQIKRRGY